MKLAEGVYDWFLELEDPDLLKLPSVQKVYTLVGEILRELGLTEEELKIVGYLPEEEPGTPKGGAKS